MERGTTDFSQHEQAHDMRREDDWRGRIFKEGDAWCVRGPGFIDPVVSAFGCGDTPKEAYERWAADAAKREEWRGRRIPQFEEFSIE